MTTAQKLVLAFVALDLIAVIAIVIMYPLVLPVMILSLAGYIHMG